MSAPEHHSLYAAGTAVIPVALLVCALTLWPDNPWGDACEVGCVSGAYRAERRLRERLD